MNADQTVESGSHLTQTGISHIQEAAALTPQIQPLDASKLQITLTASPRKVPELNSAEVFAMKTCTDHMVKCTWTSTSGWGIPTIEQYGPLTMMPIASCLHYATQCFEGLKVYRGYDGKLRLFRPERNCRRLNMSSARVALPEFDVGELETLVKRLMSIDGAKWLPKSRPGTFLYLRPAIIGIGEEIGVTAPSEVLLFIVAVLWPDFSAPKPGTAPAPPGLKLLTSKDDVRAWAGGFGYAKVGANYGPAFVAHMEGRKQGYDQILWLLGPEYSVTEAGASNFFVVWRTKEGGVELVTAPLENKIILEGVTRASVIDLVKERLVKGSKYLTEHLGSIKAVEREFTMPEIVEASKEGRMVEAFVAGTAYFITPVSAISFKGEEIEIPMGDGKSGHYAAQLKTWLSDIMYGNVNHEWGVMVNEE